MAPAFWLARRARRVIISYRLRRTDSERIRLAHARYLDLLPLSITVRCFVAHSFLCLCVCVVRDREGSVPVFSGVSRQNAADFPHRLTMFSSTLCASRRLGCLAGVDPHGSLVRRRGTAATAKRVAYETDEWTEDYSRVELSRGCGCSGVVCCHRHVHFTLLEG